MTGLREKKSAFTAVPSGVVFSFCSWQSSPSAVFASHCWESTKTTEHIWCRTLLSTSNKMRNARVALMVCTRDTLMCSCMMDWDTALGNPCPRLLSCELLTLQSCFFVLCTCRLGTNHSPDHLLQKSWRKSTPLSWSRCPRASRLQWRLGPSRWRAPEALSPR